MSFFPSELIHKKREGQNHSEDEIRWMIDRFSSGKLPDYQMSSWLMAVFFQGMSIDETTWLLQAMIDSGETLDFSHLPRPAIDKHSTGGVGDKASLILGPIAAAAGVFVPMIAGRGLGHTGGTLDKLESIPGFNINLSLDIFKRNVENLGLCIIGQTGSICPADKKMYALRDVTATVESLPLICGSIMSKKLAEGIQGLVLDVKYGSGAFMETPEKARELAQLLTSTGQKRGKKVCAHITNMNQPLGQNIGNSLEIEECLQILKNENLKNCEDLRELSLQLSASMISLSDESISREKAYEVAEEALSSGRAYEKFEQVCKVQGGRLEEIPRAKNVKEVYAEKSGYLQSYHCKNIGLASVHLGAGRMKTSDTIDPSVGLHMHKKIGDSIEKGEPLFSIHYNSQKIEEIASLLLSSTRISIEPTSIEPLLNDMIQSW